MTPTVHRFESTSDAYDASQTHDEIKDGDVLVVESERAVAVLVDAWPVAISGDHVGEAFHVASSPGVWPYGFPVEGKDYRPSYEVGRAEAAKFNETGVASGD